MNSAGLDVRIEEITETVAALAVQGPLSRAVVEAATGERWDDLKYFRRRASRVDDMEVGSAFGARPAGMLALDVARVEAGLILLEVDYTSSRLALIPEQAYSPFELGILGRFVDFDEAADFVGKRALEAERDRGGPARRLVGLEAEWDGIEAAFAAQGLPPALSPMTSRQPVPVFAGRRQVGRATSAAWSPTLKKAIALASVAREFADPGTGLRIEWTVEARRGSVPATVVDLPFLDPPRKRA